MALAKGKSKTPTKRELIERLAQLEAGSGALEVRSPDKQVTTQDKKTVWSVDMIQVLLELRLRAYASPFQGSKSNQQLSVLWEKIARDLVWCVPSLLTILYDALQSKSTLGCVMVQGTLEHSELVLPKALSTRVLVRL
ncbi:hypothetical protein DYB37_010146 [Aphanomyces astaci]|uniref:Uncharacterized protein n=1 Tax=Aphanomyces astaci TaxID=112090 RepID=A0A418EGR2_APHAT|nr:hypothetical protein DYB37_010146 [Aphanomyces astaci]